MRIRHRWLSAVSAAALLSMLAVGPASAATVAIYDSIPSPDPGNVPSLGYEATSTSEFGDRLVFAGTQRTLGTITVLMSSWGCESGSWYAANCVTTPGATFTHPITLNIYNVNLDATPGALVATATQSFAIPFRPSASPECGDGRWYQASTATCFNGLGTRITFDMTGVVVPNEVIVAVAYNTSHYGAAPIGSSAACYSSSGGCGYDSLNVGLVDPATDLTVGTNPAPDDAYLDSTWPGAYCDNGAGGTGSFRLDAAPGCWTGYKLAVEVAAALPTPANQNACKKNGWQTLFRANGSTFKNQGDCMQYVKTGK